MAITNHDRVTKALELLRAGLAPFVAREFESLFKGKAADEARKYVPNARLDASKTFEKWDAAVLLQVMWEAWRDVFGKTLGHAERTYISELRTIRNSWAHQEPFSTDDAYRALDSAGRLLMAVSAPESDEVEKAKMELLRVRFDEQARNEKRKKSDTGVQTKGDTGLKPWREVVNPHKDVASGRYQQAEFAADLWQVHIGEGSAEYKDPAEFFRRTFLTESLKRLLTGAVHRLAENTGDPVVQLQTNFGGGKTHSMLALYHLFSGVSPAELLGADAVMKDAAVAKLPKVKRVVLVGNKISTGNPSVKSDGTVVHTLWGELAWQLGGKKAYKRIQADDEKATNPGDVLRELFNEYGPCLILVDEWVAYARQLHEQKDLPGGDFETHFTFAQALTESAKLAKNCLLVISLPASDTTGSPHTNADDVEVGGERGRAALDRLRNAVGRVESSWRPASAEEGFEIVRRRLFEPLTEKDQWVARDTVARAFYDLYRTQHQEFPPECRDTDYEKRLKAAYPIHPEVFDRLYTDWSTLVKFQRTRGVLRLMAAVIHSLWEKGDRNPMIMPSMIPIEDPRVQFELTRYLSDNWVPVIEKDVDGPNALPLRIDGDVPNLGKFAACRRVARTIYMGSAPTTGAAHKGLEARRVSLGCVMPGESPAVFGDALRRLASQATYLYEDGARYWYSTQPTVTKMAEDRAEQYKRNPDAVVKELDKRLRADLRKTGDFNRVHPMPQTGAEVPDDRDARLVVLSVDHPYNKVPGCAAEQASKAILESRGSQPRLYQNTLAFLAVDSARSQDLDEAVRRYLAWQTIIDEREQLNLTPQQAKQAETQLRSADGTVTARLPEAYQWLLVPEQTTPSAPITWQAFRLNGQDPLAMRASKKLMGEERLVAKLAGTVLRTEMDKVPLWRGNHVGVKQLAEDFARYLYLPRFRDSSVLAAAIEDGLGLLLWNAESFAYADSYDEAAERYRGLRCGQRVPVAVDNSNGVLVRPDVAQQQQTQDASAKQVPHVKQGEDQPLPPSGTPRPAGTPVTVPQKPAMPTRFYGNAVLDTQRVGRDAARIADEVISHLAGLMGAKVNITIDIQAEIPNGAPEQVVRTVTENSRTLKFTSYGFERE